MRASQRNYYTAKKLEKQTENLNEDFKMINADSDKIKYTLEDLTKMEAELNNVNSHNINMRNEVFLLLSQIKAKELELYQTPNPK